MPTDRPDPLRQAGEGCTLMAAGCALPFLVAVVLVVGIILFAAVSALLSP